VKYQKTFMDAETGNKKILNITPIPARTEEVAKMVLDCAFKVHTALGPGLLESVYEACLVHELHLRSMIAETQVPLPVIYEGMKINTAVRLDILVEKCVIVEVKAVETMNPVFKAQLLTYLKLTNTRIGLLVNFNGARLKDGISRLVN
jgi:GxxExxY protein